MNRCPKIKIAGHSRLHYYEKPDGRLCMLGSCFVPAIKERLPERYRAGQHKTQLNRSTCLTIFMIFLKLQYNIDQEVITIIHLTALGNVQLADKINYTT